MSELLEACDYVVNVLPSTPHTRGLLSGDALSICKKVGKHSTHHKKSSHY